MLKNIKHYKDLVWLLYKYGNVDFLSDFSSQLDFPAVLKEYGSEKGKAEDLVKDLESLGPFYIKLGQILSAETKILPEEYDEALQKLQDKATPMPYKDVKSVIKEELGGFPEEIFQTFNKDPLSAASLGQVHVAITYEHKKVAVKIQRKDIQKTILEQLDALKNISEYLENKTEWGKKYHIIEKYEKLKETLLNELDYTKEADNLRTLDENLKDFERIIIPLPIEQYSTSRVLTMDFIKAKKITNIELLDKIGDEGPALATELFQAFLKQILIDGFFQLDPHPGNIYIGRITAKPYLAIFDLGMTARIPSQTQGKIVNLLFAVNEERELDVCNMLFNF